MLSINPQTESPEARRVAAIRRHRGKPDAIRELKARIRQMVLDGERDAKRMDKIHGKRGKGHDDPLAAYGAVVCKTCGRRALVLHDAEDFPQI